MPPLPVQHPTGPDYSALPATHRMLGDPRLAALPRALAVEASRLALAAAREAIAAGAARTADDVIDDALLRARSLQRAHLQRVVNATGVVVHTNLGRAPLHPDAAAAVQAVAQGYSNTELWLDGAQAGQRGGRLHGVSTLLSALTGAEAAVAVNNGAAALLLALTALARGREVICSRGELVEIGGSFRVPDVVSSGGAQLVEVGATNRTRVQDYADAIGPQTAVLLRVHPSNFRQVGFTERVERDALVALGRERGVLVVEDMGSGLLQARGPQAPGLAGQPWPADEAALDEAVAAGVDVVTCSGDKLLGGPQAGLACGRSASVGLLRQHPLYRALRLDKLVLAALEATLLLHREGRAAEVPVRRMLAATRSELRASAARIQAAVPGAAVEVGEGVSGGGALPGVGLPSVVVVVRGANPVALMDALRAHDPPVIARIHQGALVVDPRTLLPGEEAIVIAALRRAVGTPPAG